MKKDLFIIYYYETPNKKYYFDGIGFSQTLVFTGNKRQCKRFTSEWSAREEMRLSKIPFPENCYISLL